MFKFFYTFSFMINEHNSVLKQLNLSKSKIQQNQQMHITFFHL